MLGEPKAIVPQLVGELRMGQREPERRRLLGDGVTIEQQESRASHTCSLFRLSYRPQP